MSKNIVFRNKNYCMYRHKDNYIVHNMDKPFDKAHTHVSNFNMGKIIIYACIKGTFPSRSKRLENNKRIVNSILRVCSNKYYNRFERLLNNLDKYPPYQ